MACLFALSPRQVYAQCAPKARPGTPIPARCLVRDMPSSSPPAHDDPRSDESLMEAYQRGEGAAFEVLLARHARGLYNFLLRSVHNPARAEELLQEVLLRVIRSRARYKRSAKFTTWVYTIARNLCVDESRRARFREHASLEAPRRDGPERDARTLLQTMPADQIPTDTQAEAPRLRARLAAAIDRLPDDQREVFLMRQIAGLSFREIGQSVGAPENTVKSRMRYALEKLRQELADLHPLADQHSEAQRARAERPCSVEPSWEWSGSASDG
jgi:RNA polymerase sigma-70 factor, ECF subfamily